MSAAASAQTPIIIGPSSTLAWEDVSVPDVVTARTFVVQATIDGAAPVTLTPISCGPGPTGSPATTFTCSTPVAQIPMGSHTITLTNAVGTVVSLPSTPFTYVDLVIPVPATVRIKG